MRRAASVALAAALTTVSSAALAVTESFLVTPAGNSRTAGSESFLWFETPLVDGWRKGMTLDASGVMTLENRQTGSLTATVRSNDDPNSGFDIYMDFDQNFATPPQFKELFGAVEPSNSFFLNIAGGRMSGFGGLDGLELDVIQYPDAGGAATQVGGGVGPEVASNLYNSNFGASTWFTFTNIVEDSCSYCSSPAIQALVGSQADIVMDLNVAPVPLPASGMMMLGALGLMGAYRRRIKV